MERIACHRGLAEEDLTRVGARLVAGDLVIVPTETVYGLAASSGCASALNALYEVKGRSAAKALPLLVASAEQAQSLCALWPEAAQRLAAAFWPGPMTLVLPAKAEVSPLVRAGGPNVGLRCPAHPVTLSLLASLADPLATPSANPSDIPAPSTAMEAAALLAAHPQIAFVLDAGPAAIGMASTVIALEGDRWQILRQGVLTPAEIAAVIAG